MNLKMKKTTLAATLIACFGASAVAQSLPEPMVSAARRAVTSNPDVQARWNGFKAADNEREVVRGGFFPQLDITSNIGRESRVAPAADYGSYNYNATQLTLNQMLFDGFFTSSESKRLGLAKLTRYYELLEIAETAALEAVRAYIDVLRYRELVDAATQNYVEHKQSALLVEERSKSGVGRGVDVEQANGRLALAEYNLLVELTNLHDVSARYLRVVGDKPPASLPTLAEDFKLGTMPASADVLMREGLQGSPTLNAAVENALSYKLAIESRKASYMPRVDLRAYQAHESNTSGVIGTTRNNGIELLLSYNLYRGGADKARQRQAVDLSEQARDLQARACRDVRQTLSIAYSDVQSLASQMAYQDAHRLSTEKSLQAYRQQFELGQRTLLDVLDSQNEFFEATRSYINSRHNQALAQARTLAGMGRLVAAMGVTREDVPSAKDAGQERDKIDPADMCPMEDVVVDSIEKIKAETVLPPRVLRVVAPASPVANAPAALTPATAITTVPAKPIAKPLATAPVVTTAASVATAVAAAPVSVAVVPVAVPAPPKAVVAQAVPVAPAAPVALAAPTVPAVMATAEVPVAPVAPAAPAAPVAPASPVPSAASPTPKVEVAPVVPEAALAAPVAPIVVAAPVAAAPVAVVAVAAALVSPPPAPSAQVAMAAPAATKVRLAADTLFDFNKSEFKPGAQAGLDELAARFKGLQVDVVIDTDTTDTLSSAEYKLKLAETRAEAVKAYLQSKGVDVKRVRTVGKGDVMGIAIGNRLDLALAAPAAQ